MQHYLTYQHNVQRLFREHRDKYDGVIIPLSIATSFPTGTFGFVRALCASDASKQYAIDPRNALFQHAWNRDSVRDPHKKMAAALGEPYPSKGLTTALAIEDFASDSVLEEHVKKTLAFQLGFCQREEDARKLAKYKKMLGLDTLGKLGSPQHLIPPYYQFGSTSDSWFRVNMRCVAFSHEHAAAVPIRPVLHFGKWTDIKWSEAFGALQEQKVRSVWLYPNNFHEHEVPESELKAYREAIKTGVKSGIECFSLFGGYFAVLMSYSGLLGFSNGIGYGEWRDSGYHRGGSADTRIYMLKLHRYVDSAVAQSLVERDPEYFGADTDIIAGYVESGVSLVEIDRGEALDHFMECRQMELSFVHGQPVSAAVAELRETVRHLEGIGELEHEKYGQGLNQWADVIEKA